MSTLLWDQHNVGDAGFRSENRFHVFHRPDREGPAFFIPVVAGSDIEDIMIDLVAELGLDAVVEVHAANVVGGLWAAARLGVWTS